MALRRCRAADARARRRSPESRARSWKRRRQEQRATGAACARSRASGQDRHGHRSALGRARRARPWSQANARRAIGSAAQEPRARRANSRRRGARRPRRRCCARPGRGSSRLDPPDPRPARGDRRVASSKRLDRTAAPRRRSRRPPRRSARQARVLDLVAAREPTARLGGEASSSSTSPPWSASARSHSSSVKPRRGSCAQLTRRRRRARSRVRRRSAAPARIASRSRSRTGRGTSRGGVDATGGRRRRTPGAATTVATRAAGRDEEPEDGDRPPGTARARPGGGRHSVARTGGSPTRGRGAILAPRRARRAPRAAGRRGRRRRTSRRSPFSPGSVTKHPRAAPEAPGSKPDERSRRGALRSRPSPSSSRRLADRCPRPGRIQGSVQDRALGGTARGRRARGRMLDVAASARRARRPRRPSWERVALALTSPASCDGRSADCRRGPGRGSRRRSSPRLPARERAARSSATIGSATFWGGRDVDQVGAARGEVRLDEPLAPRSRAARAQALARTRSEPVSTSYDAAGLRQGPAGSIRPDLGQLAPRRDRRSRSADDVVAPRHAATARGVQSVGLHVDGSRRSTKIDASGGAGGGAGARAPSASELPAPSRRRRHHLAHEAQDVVRWPFFELGRCRPVVLGEEAQADHGPAVRPRRTRAAPHASAAASRFVLAGRCRSPSRSEVSTSSWSDELALLDVGLDVRRSPVRAVTFQSIERTSSPGW